MTAVPVHTTEPAPENIREMCSYAIDAWFDDISILTDEATLVQVMRDAAKAGGATVLDHTSAIFPNGAVTAVLLLAQSHLSVHTWPELGLANFDLLTCGRLHGELILEHLRTTLEPSRSNIVRTIRDVR
ncbi:adenosylmethionine decarboxylase [Plantactinospora sp. CA-290183]|uniref:adenosylmethionine decarboxylase n=1 Tax=Plantactinospora sp. CA-290183 TaxID=3240006 RepID=UPI003D8AB4D6